MPAQPAASVVDCPPIQARRSGASRGGRFRLERLLALILGVSLAAALPFLAPTVARAADPVVAAAGDIACDPLNASFNGGSGMNGACLELATSNLLVGGGYAAVLTLGDNQYFCGSLAAYRQSYDSSWGRVKSITHPVAGNHEFLASPDTNPSTGCDQSNLNAAGYFGYFGSRAGTAGQGWYSYDVGAWHLIALNSNCPNAGGCGPGSPQGSFLAADLAAHRNQCVLAYWHIPLFSSGGRAATNGQAFWDALYAAHADLVLDGHDHIYERFAPQTNRGVADPVGGITEITVGTGGANHTSIAAVAANSVVRDTTSFGILALTLHSTSYSWKFIPATGSFTDSGSATCHNAQASTATPTAKPSASPTAKPSATQTASLSPTPTSSLSPTPTASPSGATTMTIVPAADSYVDSSQPTRNFGTATAIRADGSPVVSGYLRFNVSRLSGTVTSAKLRVFANSSQSGGYTAFRVADNSWGETTITASNAPSFGAALAGSGPIAAGTWTSVDVTPAVTANGTYSFGLSTASATALSLSSRQGTNPPQLVITTKP